MYRSGKKHILIRLLLLLILPMMLSVTALADGSDDVREVIFTNEKIQNRGFTVTKSVVTASPAYPAPEDAEFGFTLFSLAADNAASPAAGEAYLLLDASGGTEIGCYYRNGVYYDYTAAEAAAAGFADYEKVERSTSDTGGFILKAGQTARFSDRTVGERFAVAETDTGGEGFTQLQPAGGKEAYVTVKEAGYEKLTFINQYEKRLPPPITNEPGNVQIFNYLETVDGYEYPAADFPITITLDGEAWAHADCTVYALTDAGGWQLLETRSTDENGVLLLQGNQKAVFENIEAYSEFAAEKGLPEHWKHVGESSLSRMVEPRSVESLSFLSRLFAIGISKSVSLPDTEDEPEADEEHDFSFTLTDGNGVALEELPYYLYDADKQPLGSTPLTVGVGGVLRLKAGQTAVLLELEEGESFIFTESSESEYRQIVPADGAPYTGTIGDTFYVLSFVNEAIKPSGDLTVNWNIINEYKNVPVSDFSFTLYKGTGEDKTPLANESYRVGSAYRTTDANGQFTLTAAETAVFEFLQMDKTYTVEELEPPIMLGHLTEDHNFSQEGTLTEDGLNFTFVNHYGLYADLSFKVVDADSPAVTLLNTEFTLERLLADGTADPDFAAVTLNADDQGLCGTQRLRVGYLYRLTQTQTQEFYTMLDTPICFALDIGESGGAQVYTAVITQNAAAPCEADITAPGSGEETFRMVLKNYCNEYELPQSGGIGSHWYTLSGLLMMAGALVYIQINRSQQRRRAINRY